ncbi:MAG: hypothetical protein MMC33_000156 [Icmadophila ericetorum]|nr:hypothetical protein [Icmadophila ericetorum]
MPTYVITGANRGLGLEFIRQLSSPSNSNILIACVRSTSTDTNDLESVITKSNSSTKVYIEVCDTSSVDSIKNFASGLPSVLGSTDSQIHYLLNSAGQNSVPNQTSISLNPSDVLAEIQINVIGPAKLTEYLLPHLRKGSVVMNMTSGLGSMQKSKTIDPPICTTYSISKAGLNMLTVHQAGQLKERGVAVFCMDPGWVKTRMGGEGADLEPEESIKSMLEIIHRKEGLSGNFFEYSGKEVPW